MSEREDTKAVVVGASRGSAVGVSSKGAARRGPKCTRCLGETPRTSFAQRADALTRLVPMPRTLQSFRGIRQTVSISNSRPVQQPFFDALPQDRGGRSIIRSSFEDSGSRLITKLPYSSLQSGLVGVGRSEVGAAERMGALVDCRSEA